jgi:hypothetical protein
VHSAKQVVCCPRENLERGERQVCVGEEGLEEREGDVYLVE